MSVREEERQKKPCSSRGLQIAAAAIGVGVGAAMYYFFSKRPENPDGEGSTTAWTEEPHAFNTSLHEDSDSYTTISQHSTTDTSMIESNYEDSDSNADSYQSNSSFESGRNDSSFGTPLSLESQRVISFSIDDLSNSEIETSSDSEIDIEWDDTFSIDDLSNSEIEISSDSEIDIDWDVTNSSVDMPEDVRSPMLYFLSRFQTPSPRPQRNLEQDRVTRLRDQQFRERSWSLEECSICFDVILKDQMVTTLPCTHHFHSSCIAPWLQEQTTCPNCRKAAE